jgi:hypothetical protein
MKAFNYAIIQLWHLGTIVCVIWLALLNCIDVLVGKSLVLVFLLFVGWFLIAFAVTFLNRKNPRCLYNTDKSNLGDLYSFNFRFWVDRDEAFSDTHLFRSENIYNKRNVKSADFPERLVYLGPGNASTRYEPTIAPTAPNSGLPIHRDLASEQSVKL